MAPRFFSTKLPNPLLEIPGNPLAGLRMFLSRHSVLCSLPVPKLPETAALSRSCRAGWSGLGPSPWNTLPRYLDTVTVSARRNSPYSKPVLGGLRLALQVLGSPGQHSSPPQLAGDKLTPPSCPFQRALCAPPPRDSPSIALPGTPSPTIIPQVLS